MTTRLAHLTDLHILEDAHGRRPLEERLKLSFLSFGRPLDAVGRKRRALGALDEARRQGAEHFLLTGDLTEDGTPEQFEALAEILEQAEVDPETVTLVPGNHDAYTHADGFARALEGPLCAFRRTSAQGAVVVLDEAVVVPVSTAAHQHVARAAGWADARGLATLGAVAGACSMRHRAVVAAMHHPPTATGIPGLQWVDGLQNHRPMRALLEAHERLHVLHGHIHRARDKVIGEGTCPRVFSAAAVVDATVTVRLYEAQDGRVMPLETPADRTLEPVMGLKPHLAA
jgi:3',5'-cyclic-AMP phosphodiesterase